jgi:hypothetical protein
MKKSKSNARRPSPKKPPRISRRWYLLKRDINYGE